MEDFLAKSCYTIAIRPPSNPKAETKPNSKPVSIVVSSQLTLLLLPSPLFSPFSMASSLFSTLLKKTLHKTTTPTTTTANLRSIPISLFPNPKNPFSSGTPISFTLSFEPEPDPEPASPAPDEDLRTRIFRLRFPKRSATAALERWAGEGRKVTQSELRDIAKELRRSQRYKHALEISEWMKTHEEFELSDSDYAMRIDLITKVFGVNAAEEFFQGLPSNAKSYEVFNALLHSYARAKQTENAENLFEKMKESNFSITVLTYNEMMTLYISVGQLEKVPLLVEELKRRNVSLDLLLITCG
ncbi:putative pentatricopeptide repeat-containing protein, mitochondrial [Iris pallida]|uniref:Pentatricopeptide repeat-containing protein, mitochondrial n=1 Tax=Iris pallida TaxID=29817 RepID=A0AAX6HQR6_IRIPA|nr:putative pentatricopeptide repeat-containing protein, mitochondrial [Iris pallida]